MKKEELYKIVMKQLEDLSETLPEDQKFLVSRETILFGRGSSIDSMSLVSVIVDLEGFFFDEIGLEISLTDDNAMTREISPFDNVGNLVDYLDELINP
jgi:acyl carrier protein